MRRGKIYIDLPSKPSCVQGTGDGPLIKIGSLHANNPQLSPPYRKAEPRTIKDQTASLIPLPPRDVHPSQRQSVMEDMTYRPTYTEPRFLQPTMKWNEILVKPDLSEHQRQGRVAYMDRSGSEIQVETNSVQRELKPMRDVVPKTVQHSSDMGLRDIISQAQQRDSILFTRLLTNLPAQAQTPVLTPQEVPTPDVSLNQRPGLVSQAPVPSVDTIREDIPQIPTMSMKSNKVSRGRPRMDLLSQTYSYPVEGDLQPVSSGSQIREATSLPVAMTTVEVGDPDDTPSKEVMETIRRLHRIQGKALEIDVDTDGHLEPRPQLSDKGLRDPNLVASGHQTFQPLDQESNASTEVANKFKLKTKVSSHSDSNFNDIEVNRLEVNRQRPTMLTRDQRRNADTDFTEENPSRPLLPPRHSQPRSTLNRRSGLDFAEESNRRPTPTLVRNRYIPGSVQREISSAINETLREIFPKDTDRYQQRLPNIVNTPSLTPSFSESEHSQSRDIALSRKGVIVGQDNADILLFADDEFHPQPSFSNNGHRVRFADTSDVIDFSTPDSTPGTPYLSNRNSLSNLSQQLDFLAPDFLDNDVRQPVSSPLDKYWQLPPTLPLTHNLTDTSNTSYQPKLFQKDKNLPRNSDLFIQPQVEDSSQKPQLQNHRGKSVSQTLELEVEDSNQADDLRYRLSRSQPSPLRPMPASPSLWEVSGEESPVSQNRKVELGSWRR